MRILLVEDDPMIGRDLQKALKQSGFAINWVKDGLTADEALRVENYDVVVLDLGLPGQSGLDVLGQLRTRSDTTPVLILTARDSVLDRVKGLDNGADDYLLKPFALEELEARIRSLMRRRAGQAGGESGVLTSGALSIDLKTHETIYGQQRAVLSGREFSLLYALIKTTHRALSKTQLEEAIYGWDEEIASNAVEVHIYQIRKKLGADIIRNIRNVGYTLAHKAEGRP